MVTDDHHLRLRLPKDLKVFVQESARHNQRSMNGEIVFVLRQHQQSASAPTA